MSSGLGDIDTIGAARIGGPVSQGITSINGVSLQGSGVLPLLNCSIPGQYFIVVSRAGRVCMFRVNSYSGVFPNEFISFSYTINQAEGDPNIRWQNQ